MPKEGYLAIRNLPKKSDEALDKKEYSELLRKFSKKHKKCPKCKGRRFTYKIEPEHKEESPSSIKVTDLVDSMSNFEESSFSDTVKNIILYTLFGQRPCAKCKGLGFIRRNKDVSKSTKKDSA